MVAWALGRSARTAGEEYSGCRSCAGDPGGDGRAMTPFVLLKTLHVIGATVLLGTGAGIAFFMLMAHRTRDPKLVAHTAGVVVVADGLFTATAVVLQPLTGAALAHIAGYPLLSGWVAASLALYVAV